MTTAKQFMIEYILTNGTLPEFQERLELSKPFWKTATEPFIVYRGQGHEKPGITAPPNTVKNVLKNIVTPVISTSKNINSVIDFTDKQGCCIFEITVEPGIQYLDFTEITDVTKDDIEFFMTKKKNIENNAVKGIYPFNYMPTFLIFNDFKKRHAREEEILLYGCKSVENNECVEGGTFKKNGEETLKTFTIEIKSKKRKRTGPPEPEYKTIEMRVIKYSYGPKAVGGNQKKTKTRKRVHRKSQRSKTLQRKSK